MIEEMLDANVIEPTAFAWLLQIYKERRPFMSLTYCSVPLTY